MSDHIRTMSVSHAEYLERRAATADTLERLARSGHGICISAQAVWRGAEAAYGIGSTSEDFDAAVRAMGEIER